MDVASTAFACCVLCVFLFSPAVHPSAAVSKHVLSLWNFGVITSPRAATAKQKIRDRPTFPLLRKQGTCVEFGPTSTEPLHYNSIFDFANI